MIVAVGPSATAALAAGHPDLALLDAFPIGVAVCMFDVRDEEWWARAAERVRDLPKPRLFVVAADPHHRAMLGRLACTFDACVIASRPTQLLRAALLPLAGLVRPGLIGCDVSLIEEVFRAPAVAAASFDLDQEHPADSILGVGRDPTLSLHGINELFMRLVHRHPEADIFATAPLWEYPVHEELIATGYIAVERLPSTSRRDE